MTTRASAAFAVLAALLLAPARPGLSQDPVVAAAGDIACDPADPNFNAGLGTAGYCRQKATSDLLVGTGLSAVLLLGDDQYENGSLAKFVASYDPSWGRVKPITRPAPGNHEYYTAGASGYYAYFGAVAGDPSKGWYSFDLGAWHVVVLNSNCADVGGCGAGSLQEQWLRADLAAHPGVCTLATWHVPRFSSGTHGNDPAPDAFWRALYDAGADVVLNGHDHDYERFDPQDPDGLADPARGIREFVVGTGGKNQTPFVTIRANSAARSTGTFGVLRLTLRPAGYDWQFVPAAGGTYGDAGSATCHRAPHPRRYFTVAPCRLVDTRGAPGPTGGPALNAGVTRDLPAVSQCGVPATATALSLNATVIDPTHGGHLVVRASGIPDPGTSTLNFSAWQNRANFAIVEIGAYGRISATPVLASPAGTTHLVVDVAGYWE
jgi:hypothetical protein